MDSILIVVKVLVIIQILLITIFVILMYAAKYYFLYLDKKNNKKIADIRKLFFLHLNESSNILPKIKNKLQRSIDKVLLVLNEMQQSHSDLDNFNAFKTQLLTLVIKPKAKQWIFSHNWFKRYYAVQCYGYGLDPDDEAMLLQLLKDKVLLVSINAALIAVKYNNPILINEVISTFSQGRHLQQSFFSEVITTENHGIAPIIEDRLKKELDPYVKLFCYRLLTRLPKKTIIPHAKIDLLSNIINLKIAIVEYIVHCEDQRKNEIIYPLIMDSHWEVRAVVARALGTISSEKSLKLLTDLLCDAEWWVRINAANSLYQHGQSGIAILESQLPEKDRFAYETAQKVLIIGKNHA